MSRTEFCSPKCGTFRCGQNAAIFQQKRVWCRWTEDDCDVSTCNFATCIKRRLLPNGICGETVRRKTIEKEPVETRALSVKLKAKVLRKMGEKEIF